MFIMTSQRMLKKDSIHKIMNFMDHWTIAYRKEIKVIGLMKDELGGQIMTEFVELRPKTYSYLMDNGNSDKKAKATKNI